MERILKAEQEVHLGYEPYKKMDGENAICLRRSLGEHLFIRGKINPSPFHAGEAGGDLADCDCDCEFVWGDLWVREAAIRLTTKPYKDSSYYFHRA